ncbi:MAG: AAA family ATPase, partial [Deltaproteobacteria bacterium]|nr:AAA family ATPase [Deltaproteobacteria bacterium]
MSLYLSTPGLAERLAPFVEAGALLPGEAHAVDRLGRLAREADVDVLLGCAFALRAPRVGDAGVFLDRLPAEFTLEREEPVDFAWPAHDGGAWTARARRSPLVGPDEAGTPFRLGDDQLLQTRRLASYEARLARALAARAGMVTPVAIDGARLRHHVELAFPLDKSAQLQRLAGVLAVLCRTTLITGGPGTGKTTTVARVLRLLHGQAIDAQAPLPRVALAAPTGKAAARMREALVHAADEEPGPAADWVASLGAQTLHRLLGYNPATPSRFRHDANNPLGQDVVIVDEASMIDVALMCKLVEAVSPEARLVLLGDRNQLASVEAGSVLGDFAAAIGTEIRLPPAVASAVASVLGAPAVNGLVDPAAPALASGLVSYTTAFRFAEPRIGNPIYRLADASREPAREAEHLAAALDQLLGRGAAAHPPGSAVAHVENPATGLQAELLDRVVADYAAILAPLVRAPADAEARGSALAALDGL